MNFYPKVYVAHLKAMEYELTYALSKGNYEWIKCRLYHADEWLNEGMRFSLPSRDVIADSVELMIEAHRFDAMVCIVTCDRIVPGMMIAIACLNIPTIFCLDGPMYHAYPKWGYYSGKSITVGELLRF